MSKRELEKIRKLMCTQKFDKIDAWYKVVKDEGHTFITHMYNNCQGLTLNSSSRKWQVIWLNIGSKVTRGTKCLWWYWGRGRPSVTGRVGWPMTPWPWPGGPGTCRGICREPGRPVGIHRDTCLASIHRVASWTVVNSTKAKPLDAPRRKNTHKQVLINNDLIGGVRDTQRRTLIWPWVGPVATNQPHCAHLAGIKNFTFSGLFQVTGATDTPTKVTGLHSCTEGQLYSMSTVIIQSHASP